jgi:hypothetical protein
VTPDRADSYLRLTRFLSEDGPARLHPDEDERVREAADTLVLSPAWSPDVARALDDISDLAGRLADSGRWELEAAERLIEQVAACGPDEAGALALR